MMRAWRAKFNLNAMPGLLLDSLAYTFITSWPYRDKSYLYYDFMSRDFFAYMAAQSTAQQYWLAPGSGRRVYGTVAFQNKASQAYKLSLEAITYQGKNMDYSAKSKWRDIFGTNFFPG
jgi:hypothetical protein